MFLELVLHWSIGVLIGVSVMLFILDYYRN